MALANAARTPHLRRYREVLAIHRHPSAAVAPFARRKLGVRRTGARIVSLRRLPSKFDYALVSEFHGLRVDGKIRLRGSKRAIKRGFQIIERHDVVKHFRPRLRSRLQGEFIQLRVVCQFRRFDYQFRYRCQVMRVLFERHPRHRQLP